MTNFFYHPGARRSFMNLLSVVPILVIFFLTLRVMQARQHGLGIIQSFQSVLSHDLLKENFKYIIVFAVLILFLTTRAYSLDIGGKETTVEAGQNQEKSNLKFFTIIVIPILIYRIWIILTDLIKSQWLKHDWYLDACVLFSVLILFFSWRNPPGAERLYFLETNDTSRENDERMQQLQGKAAKATITVMLALLVYIGIPYEAIITGNWPYITIVAIGVLCLIWTAALTYWNRRI